MDYVNTIFVNRKLQPIAVKQINDPMYIYLYKTQGSHRRLCVLCSPRPCLSLFRHLPVPVLHSHSSLPA